MSDYGYRPDPPPEDGRSYGGASGRAYGSASPGGHRGAAGDPPNDPDYGWGGGSSPQHPGTGAYGSARPSPGPGPYGTPASGSASVGGRSGRASVGGPATGSASVGGGATGRTGRASVGSASVGSASVGSASVGKASVGSASVGSASVGSASVGTRPIDLDDEPTGRASVGGRRRAGKPPLSEDDLKDDKKAKKKRRRRKIYAGLIAVGVVFVAAITVVGAWFFQDVPAPDTLRREGESSTFLFADGSTEAGGYGESLRKLVDSREEIPDTVVEALVALEDRNFYDHGGVDYRGTMRALVNNVTGGDQQGASTITQQYAGMVADIRNDVSYGRKAREAVMAMKLEQDYSKDEIVTFYLNLAYFGRGATGIEAAAQVYYDKPLLELDYAEAAYVVMQVKSPNGYYDPYYEDAYSESATLDRWNHAMDSLVSEGYLSQSDRDAFEFPTPKTEDVEVRGSWGGDTPLGFIVNEQDGYVFDELSDRYSLSKEDLYGGENGEGGYTVTLTIDQDVQKALESTNSRGPLEVETDGDGNYLNSDDEVVDSIAEAAKKETDDGYWYFANGNDDAALKEYDPYMTSAQVAIDPATGAVVGYYGGDDGFGIDKAGPESPHPPSSTFKMITAATAIEHDASIESWWDASSPRQFETLANEEEETCIGGGDYPDCTLRNGTQTSSIDMTLTDAVRQSKNTPMYAISEDFGAEAILKLADDMGLHQMSQTRQLYDDDGGAHDVSVTYKLDSDYNYTQHGPALDDDGNWITNALGNIDNNAPLRLDGSCNPIVNTDGNFLAAENGEAESCDIGGKGTTDPFYHHLAFGQYPTSVRDMAAMYATIANDGVYNETHFVAEVRDREGNVVQPDRDLESKQALAVETARDLQWVGSEISGEASTDGEFERPYFGKTGTWEASGKDKDGEDYPSSWNAHAWYVGAIPQLSIATWVGNITNESDPIADRYGDKSNVFGSNTAYPVWQTAMDRIIDAKDGDDGWGSEDWEGKAVKGVAITTDIENADGSIDPSSAYCQKNPDDAKCGIEEEEEEEDTGDECQDAGVGNPNCETDLPTDTPTDEPTDDNGGGDDDDDDNCNWITCPDDPTTDPGGGGGEDPTDTDR